MVHARMLQENDPGPRSVAKVVEEKSVCDLQAISGIGASSAVNSLLIQTLLNNLIEIVAVVAADGTILSANHTWMETIALDQGSSLSPNDNLISHFSAMAAAGDKAAFALLRGLAELQSGRQTRLLHTYAGRGRLKGRTFTLNLIAHRVGKTLLLLVTGVEATTDLKSKHDYRELLKRYQEVQDQERRRIARELHDSTSQLLVGLQFGLISLRRSGPSDEIRTALDQCDETLALLHREIRALSFIYHPPAFNAGSMIAGLKRMLKGFSERSGINIEMVVGKIGNIPAPAAMVLYRVAQEALANVFRHARASKVRFCLTRTNGCARLIINDDGIGFEPGNSTDATAIGVGLTSMQERVAESNGHLEIKKMRSGTSLFVSLPLGKAS